MGLAAPAPVPLGKIPETVAVPAGAVGAAADAVLSDGAVSKVAVAVGVLAAAAELVVAAPVADATAELEPPVVLPLLLLNEELV